MEQKAPSDLERRNFVPTVIRGVVADDGTLASPTTFLGAGFLKRYYAKPARGVLMRRCRVAMSAKLSSVRAPLGECSKGEPGWQLHLETGMHQEKKPNIMGEHTVIDRCFRRSAVLNSPSRPIKDDRVSQSCKGEVSSRGVTALQFEVVASICAG